jgi:hypothetical protein
MEPAGRPVGASSLLTMKVSPHNLPSAGKSSASSVTPRVTLSIRLIFMPPS